MAAPHAKSRSASERATGPSFKPYLAIAALLVVVGVASFSLMERWLSETAPESSGDDAPIADGGRVVIGRSSSTTAPKQRPAAGSPSSEAPYKPQEFTFYKSLGNAPQTTPKLDPTRPSEASIARSRPSVKPGERAQATGRKSYTVQIGSFQDRKSAERLSAKMRRYQYTVSVNRVVLPDSGVRYRVRIGSFATRDDALKVAEMLKKKERVEPFVALVAPFAG